MKILKIKPVSGLLSDLQSDTIYGHFCWRLKDRLGEDKLKDFINLYRNNNPIFLLSDGLLSSKEDILFPNPLVFYEFEIPQKKTDKIIDFVKRKSEKESKFISLSQLNSFLSSGSFSTEITEPQIENKSTKILEEHLRVSVQIDRNNFTSADGKLFSYNPKYLSDDYYYSVLIKILDDNLFKEFDCENVLKDVFEIGFGKKKSSGFGQFQFVSFEEFNGIKEPEKSDSFIVLGNYLPASDDKVEPIGYDINTKYGKFGEDKSKSPNPFKNPMVLLTAGSCFKTDNSDKSYYGRITNPGEISDSHPETVQFGCPVFLRFNNNLSRSL